MDLINNISSTLQLWSLVLIHDFLRYAIFAGGGMLIFWVWKREAWKHRRIQSAPQKAKKLRMELYYSLLTILLFSLVGFGLLTAKEAGLTMIYSDVNQYGWLYTILSLPLLIIIHDAWFYWSHRIMHHKKIFKHVHAVHHRSLNPSPLAAYSFHPLEALVEAIFYPIVLFTIPYHEVVMLGFVLTMIIKNVLAHSGFEIFPKGFIRNKHLNWNTTATHHDMHHKYFNSNFGLYFSWWDKWMNTEHKDYEIVYNEITSREKLALTPVPEFQE